MIGLLCLIDRPIKCLVLSDWFNRVMKAVPGGNLQLAGAPRRACDGQWVMLSQIYTLSNSLPLPLLRYSRLPNKRTIRYCGNLCCQGT